MKNRDYHEHCLLCEESYSNHKKAEECFKNHSELEHLKWVAAQVCYMKSYMYDLMYWIDFINKKYGIEDEFDDQAIRIMEEK